MIQINVLEYWSFKELQGLFFEYSNFIIILPLFLSFRLQGNFKKNRYYLIRIYLILSTLTQITSFILWKCKINNFPLLHLFTVFEFLVLIKFFSNLLKSNFFNQLFSLLSVLFVLFCLTDSLIIRGQS